MKEVAKYCLFFLIALVLVPGVSYSISTALIIGKGDSLKDGDTVLINVFSYSSRLSSSFAQTHKVLVVDGQFRLPASFRTNICHFTIMVPGPRLCFGLLENGDSLVVDFSNNKLVFSGRGEVKNSFRAKCTEVSNQLWKGVKLLDGTKFKLYLELSDSVFYRSFKLLDQIRPQLSQLAYKVMAADLFGIINQPYYSFKRIAIEDRPIALNDLKRYKSGLNIDSMHDATMDDNFSYSGEYIDGLISRFNFDSCTLKGRSFDFPQCYTYFKEKYSGLLREAILANLIVSNARTRNDMSRFVTDALTFFEINPDFRTIIADLDEKRRKGRNAFEFSLQDVTGRVWTMNDFKGKVVLIDYWYTGCPACPRIKPYIERYMRLYKGKEIAFISVSCDKTKEKWLSGLSEGIYTSSEATNLYSNGEGAKHAIFSYYGIDAFPSIILIDSKSKLSRQFKMPDIDGGMDLEAALNELL
ncbi:TlpA disulfide reductase family protein [uncultured Chitinophaga sp.]|uniref:TlpA family protein disulfide reductase n=1 Tax=uncultured Chitinophaga sp. TaxID=339340 RepID=UPI0025ED6F1E|nr:TlpA disulfide reductase family protein [uncultured Chitinophaga sp.]